jgi:glycosyltransferase involved in cell wall biosynthesis
VRITFDYQVFSSQAQGGISRYFVELGRHLVALGDCDVEILAPLYINEYLRRAGGGLLAPPGARYDWLARCVTRAPPGVRRREASFRRRVNQAVSRWRLRRSEPDILHETVFETDPLPIATARRLLTVQDMIDEVILAADGRTSPAYIQAKHRAILRADHIICASEQTRGDLLKLLPIPETKTSVVYHGCRAAGAWPGEGGLPAGLSPFCLFVGSRGTYKNFDRLLRAYAMSRRLNGEVTLVAFGGGSFTERERQMANELGIADRSLVQVEGDDSTLVALYRHARCCVYPSLYEGFGLVPLEAMTFGCPVVTTHRGSLREVVADAAEIVDPDDPASIGAGWEAAAFDETRRLQLRAAGVTRAQLFTWQKCATETRAVYQDLLA